MRHDERFAVVIFFVLALVSVSAVMYLFVNAKSQHPSQVINPFFLTGGAVRHYCSDSDFGINPYVRGITSSEQMVVVDRCTTIGVVERYCELDGSLGEVVIPCLYGCNGGACSKESPTGFVVKGS